MILVITSWELEILLKLLALLVIILQTVLALQPLVLQEQELLQHLEELVVLVVAQEHTKEAQEQVLASQFLLVITSWELQALLKQFAPREHTRRMLVALQPLVLQEQALQLLQEELVAPWRVWATALQKMVQLVMLH